MINTTYSRCINSLYPTLHERDFLGSAGSPVEASFHVEPGADLAEIVLERGIVFTHETIRDWEARFAPVVAEQLRRSEQILISTIVWSKIIER